MIVYPPGYRAGCNRRATKFGACCRLLADEVETIPRDDWQQWIGKVSLRPHVKTILDQNGYGSCATESPTQGLMIVRDVGGHPFVLLNPLSIYRVTSGGSDNGSSIDENLAFARTVGILPEAYWPRSKGFHATPPAGWQAEAAKYKIGEFYDIATEDEFGSALLRGFAVVFGWSGHSVIATSLLSTTKFEYANSWGDWGDQGFGTLALSSVNWGYGAFAIRTPLSNDAPAPPSPLSVRREVE